MTIQTVHHTIRALGPISHGSLDADTGNVMLFRRSVTLSPDGRRYHIPHLSAGALRGVVRRALWREAFDAVGLSREAMDGRVWDRLYAALANGGTIEASEARVSPDKIRSRRAELPVLSLLGAALYTSHMAGAAKVSNSWLVCRESAAANITRVMGPGVDMSMEDLLQEESRVRHVDQEEQNPDESGVGPMPTTIEVVCAGSAFAGHSTVRGELEASAWAHGLDLISHIGGKSAAGFGEVDIAHDGDGALYVAWLKDNREALRKSLEQLAEELLPAKKAKKK